MDAIVWLRSFGDALLVAAGEVDTQLGGTGWGGVLAMAGWGDLFADAGNVCFPSAGGSSRADR
eukprot:3926710-Lingulodinium_polyedra.AAC.1